jgi:Zn-finger nucleic acid-binding protein
MQNYEVNTDYCPSCKGVWLDRGEIDKIAKIQTVTKTNTITNTIIEMESRMTTIIIIDLERGFLDDLFYF